MNIEVLIREIANLDQNIRLIEGGMQMIDKKIIQKQKEATIMADKAAREKDPRREINYKKDLIKKDEEISKLKRERSTKQKSLSDKQKKKLELKLKLNNEEQKQRERIKKEQKEMLSFQQQLASNIEKQKRHSFISVNSLNPVQM